jgi:hypothetical protein
VETNITKKVHANINKIVDDTNIDMITLLKSLATIPNMDIQLIIIYMDFSTEEN